jgi:hypothetical protein
MSRSSQDTLTIHVCLPVSHRVSLFQIPVIRVYPLYILTLLTLDLRRNPDMTLLPPFLTWPLVSRHPARLFLVTFPVLPFLYLYPTRRRLSKPPVSFFEINPTPPMAQPGWRGTQVPLYIEEAVLTSLWRTFTGGVAKATKLAEWGESSRRGGGGVLEGSTRSQHTLFRRHITRHGRAE